MNSVLNGMTFRIRAAQRADAASIAKVHVDAWRTSYAGLVPAEFLAAMSYAERTARWADILATTRPLTCTFVAATADGQIVGFAGGGPERAGNPDYPGELYAVYLHPQYQRQGLGRRLVAATARRMRRDGFQSLWLWVLEDNHSARRFYEALGGQWLDDRKTIAIGGADLEEIAYGWKDISVLAEEDAP